jgi:hypothetical protein
LKYLDLFNWFENYSAEELVRIYGTFGGTPAYLEYVDAKLSAQQNIVEKILGKSSPLYDEPEMLLNEEIRTPQRYMDILTALASGKNTLSEIADVTGLNRESTTVYLRTLEVLDLIERVTSVTEPEAKRGVYCIRDHFFSFWFRFVRPNKRQLELELENNFWQSASEDFNRYLGHVFEEVCREVLVELAKRDMLPIRLARVGRWWWKEIEIDLLGLDAKNRNVLAVEAKWSEIGYLEAKRLLFELGLKSQNVKEVKEATFGLIAKKIGEKEKLRNEGFLALDLWDIEKLAPKPAK